MREWEVGEVEEEVQRRPVYDCSGAKLKSGVLSIGLTEMCEVR